YKLVYFGDGDIGDDFNQQSVSVDFYGNSFSYTAAAGETDVDVTNEVFSWLWSLTPGTDYPSSVQFLPSAMADQIDFYADGPITLSVTGQHHESSGNGSYNVSTFDFVGAVPGDTYELTVDNVTYSYTALAGDDGAAVASALYSQADSGWSGSVGYDSGSLLKLSDDTSFTATAVTASRIETTDGITYSLSIVPDSDLQDGTVEVYLEPGQVKDLAGNYYEPAAPDSATVMAVAENLQDGYVRVSWPNDNFELKLNFEGNEFTINTYDATWANAVYPYLANELGNLTAGGDYPSGVVWKNEGNFADQIVFEGPSSWIPNISVAGSSQGVEISHYIASTPASYDIDLGSLTLADGDQVVARIDGHEVVYEVKSTDVSLADIASGLKASIDSDPGNVLPALTTSVSGSTLTITAGVIGANWTVDVFEAPDPVASFSYDSQAPTINVFDDVDVVDLQADEVAGVMLEIDLSVLRDASNSPIALATATTYNQDLTVKHVGGTETITIDLIGQREIYKVDGHDTVSVSFDEIRQALMTDNSASFPDDAAFDAAWEAGLTITAVSRVDVGFGTQNAVFVASEDGAFASADFVRLYDEDHHHAANETTDEMVFTVRADESLGGTLGSADLVANNGNVTSVTLLDPSTEAGKAALVEAGVWEGAHGVGLNFNTSYGYQSGQTTVDPTQGVRFSVTTAPFNHDGDDGMTADQAQTISVYRNLDGEGGSSFVDTAAVLAALKTVAAAQYGSGFDNTLIDQATSLDVDVWVNQDNAVSSQQTTSYSLSDLTGGDTSWVGAVAANASPKPNQANDSGEYYQVVVTPDTNVADANVTLSVATGATITDLAGNALHVAGSDLTASLHLDNVDPAATVSITSIADGTIDTETNSLTQTVTVKVEGDFNLYAPAGLKLYDASNDSLLNVETWNVGAGSPATQEQQASPAVTTVEVTSSGTGNKLEFYDVGDVPDTDSPSVVVEQDGTTIADSAGLLAAFKAALVGEGYTATIDNSGVLSIEGDHRNEIIGNGAALSVNYQPEVYYAAAQPAYQEYTATVPTGDLLATESLYVKAVVQDDAGNQATVTSVTANYFVTAVDNQGSLVTVEALDQFGVAKAGVLLGADTVRVTYDPSEFDLPKIDTVTADMSDFGGSATESLSLLLETKIEVTSISAVGDTLELYAPEWIAGDTPLVDVVANGTTSDLLAAFKAALEALTPPYTAELVNGGTALVIKGVDLSGQIQGNGVTLNVQSDRWYEGEFALATFAQVDNVAAASVSVTVTDQKGDTVVIDPAATLAVDTMGPSIVRIEGVDDNSATHDFVVGNSANFEIEFSEQVILGDNDIEVFATDRSGVTQSVGNLANIQTTDDGYTYTITVDGLDSFEGTVSVGLASNATVPGLNGNNVNAVSLSQPATVDVDNVDPTFTSTAPLAVDEIDELNESITDKVIYDADANGGSPVTYSLKAVGDSTLLQIDPQTGVVSANPDVETPATIGAGGKYSFTVVATDAAGNQTEEAVVIDVNDLNDNLPTLANAGFNTGAAPEDAASPVSFDLLSGADDADAGTTVTLVPGSVTYSVDGSGLSVSLPAGVSFDPTTSTVSVDPSDSSFQNLSAGVERKITVNYQVTDAATGGNVVDATYEVTITGTNDAPVLTGETKSLTETDVGAGASVAGQVGLTDADDTPAQVTAQANVPGTYGTFSIASNG
ncbi:VCBS domain-containing protein, partial [Burkholderiaceae bacterium]|nr:VCBS domain-containing protein [Burkholderiaceae bacterium]